MAYTQTRPFVIANAGTVKYLCLANVRKGYGIPAKYDYAYLDWQNNAKQHPDQNYPAGVAVPVYFSWVGTVGGVNKNWGHIAVRLPDGRIWTDGRYYNSVGELLNNYLSNGRYLGWGESVNGIRVVREVADMAQKIDGDRSRQLGFHYLGRNGKDGRPNALQFDQADLVGRDLTLEELSRLFLSAESKAWRDGRLNKVYEERDAYKQQNSLLKQQNADLQAKLDQCGDGADTQNLNKLKEALNWFKGRMGW